MENYSLLCSLTIQHAYFENGLCDNLALVPDPATQKLMSNAHLAFIQTDHGWNVYYDTNHYQQGAQILLAGKSLRFILTSSDTSFLNYTLLPFFSNSSILYFSNANKNAKSISALPLTATKNAGPKDVYTLQSSTLTCPVAKNKSNCKLKDAQGNPVEPSSTNATASTFTQLNGAYTLTNSEGTTSLFANDFISYTKPLGVVELYLCLQGNTSSVFDEHTIRMKNFVINFDARSAKWRYFIVNKTNMKINNLCIASTDNKIMFVDNGSVTRQNLPASVLVSKAAIKMQQYPDKQFNLTLKSSNRSNVFSNIVVPSAGSLTTENQTNFIDAYLYI